MNFKYYISLNEASYDYNLGFEELVLFYQKATDKEIQELEIFLKKLDDTQISSKDWDTFRKLIKKVTGILLK